MLSLLTVLVKIGAIVEIMREPLASGDWDEEWNGWWGAEPPYHAPVFVLTHHGHDPIQMDGGTTFHFVTEGFDAAYSAACRAQALIAGVIDALRSAERFAQPKP